ncbi:MAG: SPOR domain-containing protein [Saprospiraceae bacterium]|nr:SPOR domain-containing protein [Saprospiraceae bacterium]
MKKIVFLALCLPVIGLIMAYKPTTEVSFSKTDWDSAKTKAISEKKIYFVDFDANYCATCRNMDETTYQSERLAEYMEGNVIANRVNIQDFDGVMWSQRYDIEALPTMLFFNEEGRLVKRVVGYKSAQQLLDIFRSIKSKNVSAEPIPTTQDETPMAEDNIPNNTVKPDVLLPKNNNETKIVNKSPSELDNVADILNPDRISNQPKGKGLFEISVDKQKSDGYSIQVGVYSTYENLLNAVANLRKKFQKKTLIHVDEIGGKLVYKLLLGTFSSRRDASSFRSMLRSKGIDGMVRDLRLLK